MGKHEMQTEPTGWDEYDAWATGNNNNDDKDYLFELIHSKWMPADENSQRKIYYYSIASFLIGAVTKNSKRNISVDAIKHFLSRASLVQDAAVENGLPVDDVVDGRKTGRSASLC